MALMLPRNYGCRLWDDYAYKGMRVVVLENELLRISILVDKGTDIFEFLYKPYDLDFMYLSPNGIRSPLEVGSKPDPGGPFLDRYEGGWQEILPNGGPPIVYKGAHLGQHGEISLIPWLYHPVEDTAERVSARFWVRTPRLPLFLQKTLTLERGRAVLTTEETLTNEGNEPVDLMWGHHIAFSVPALAGGARIDTSARRLLVHGEMPGLTPRRLRPDQQTRWPIARGPDGEEVDHSLIPPQADVGYCEMSYLTDWDGGAWYALTNTGKQVGFAAVWDAEHFKYLWYWSELGAQTGYPWWGRFYTIALEPWTSFPTNGLLDAVERGTQLVLQPGESAATTLRAVAYDGLASVSAVSPAGDVTGQPPGQTHN
jgi:galactose mutarotase-like enzyme